ncbi:cuticle protein CP14.6-like [Penaeus chinensis]|uniref:cuticle protein CP14.6-like n=1 Tax=Penaeus chinensis TaxID=139456 RepID=UPI001FB627E8|nr:cuticle protein CP14.6-like [Penaeus chinensis]
MKVLSIACVAAVVVAAPQNSYDAPRVASNEEREFVPILKDDRVHEEDETYNFDFEAANGISFSQAGSPDTDEDAVIKAGEYSYTAPDGTEIHVRFVADENGFQPRVTHLPVAPAFPHPIPHLTQSDRTHHCIISRDKSNGIPHSQATFPDSEEDLWSNISDSMRF